MNRAERRDGENAQQQAHGREGAGQCHSRVDAAEKGEQRQDRHAGEQEHEQVSRSRRQFPQDNLAVAEVSDQQKVDGLAVLLFSDRIGRDPWRHEHDGQELPDDEHGEDRRAEVGGVAQRYRSTTQREECKTVRGKEANIDDRDNKQQRQRINGPPQVQAHSAAEFEQLEADKWTEHARAFQRSEVKGAPARRPSVVFYNPVSGKVRSLTKSCRSFESVVKVNGKCSVEMHGRAPALVVEFARIPWGEKSETWRNRLPALRAGGLSPARSRVWSLIPRWCRAAVRRPPGANGR